MLLVVAGWPRRIGFGLLGLSLLVGVIGAATRPGADATTAGPCATAAAWQRAAVERDDALASVIQTAQANPSRSGYLTAVAAVDDALAVRAAPTMIAPWWDAYAASLVWTRARLAGVLNGEPGAFVPQATRDAIAATQDAPLAAYHAACG